MSRRNRLVSALFSALFLAGHSLRSPRADHRAIFRARFWTRKVRSSRAPPLPSRVRLCRERTPRSPTRRGASDSRACLRAVLAESGAGRASSLRAKDIDVGLDRTVTLPIVLQLATVTSVVTVTAAHRSSTRPPRHWHHGQRRNLQPPADTARHLFDFAAGARNNRRWRRTGGIGIDRRENHTSSRD